MTGRDLPDVRDAIQELRESDRRSANVPAFGTVLHRRRVPRRHLTAPALLAIATGLAIVTIVSYRIVASRPGRLELPKEVAALSAWRPMTDALLETPGRELLRDASPMGRSIINVTTKGVLR